MEEVTNEGKMIDATWPVLRLRGLGDGGTELPPWGELGQKGTKSLGLELPCLSCLESSLIGRRGIATQALSRWDHPLPHPVPDLLLKPKHEAKQHLCPSALSQFFSWKGLDLCCPICAWAFEMWLQSQVCC